jgi:hypothetical protein
MKRIDVQAFSKEPQRYELRSGEEHNDAPKCPFGNTYQWVGYDLENKEYVRFTKGVFKKLIHLNN